MAIAAAACTRAASLRNIGHPPAPTGRLVWQIMTILGWIGFTPIILKTRGNHWPRLPKPGPRRSDGGRLAGHVVLVLVLSITTRRDRHTLRGCSSFRCRELGGAHKTAFMAYLPLDASPISRFSRSLRSDMERHRREALQREAALRASRSRVVSPALRARLNPHFLLNALNSVGVLARAGKREGTGESRRRPDVAAPLRARRTHATVSARDELQFVREYLAVQKVRLANGCDSKSAPEACCARQYRSFCCNPSVEKRRGARTWQVRFDGGSVGVAVVRAMTLLVITVTTMVRGGTGVGGRIGLSSTRERLARLFGDRATLRSSRVRAREGDARYHSHSVRGQARRRMTASIPQSLLQSLLRVVIVDDEPLAREGLRDAVARLAMPNIEIGALCENGVVALDVHRAMQPEILLLDIAMPVLDGFAMLERSSPKRRRGGHLRDGVRRARATRRTARSSAMRNFSAHRLDEKRDRSARMRAARARRTPSRR